MKSQRIIKRIIFWVVASVGAYFLYKKIRSTVCEYDLTDAATEAADDGREWLAKVKEEVWAALKPFKELSEEEYDRVAETVAYHYGRLYRVNAKEFATAAEDLRADWERVRDQWKEMIENEKKKRKFS